MNNICPLLIRNRASKQEFYNKQLLLTIMMQLASQSKNNKHLWQQ